MSTGGSAEDEEPAVVHGVGEVAVRGAQDGAAAVSTMEIIIETFLPVLSSSPVQYRPSNQVLDKYMEPLPIVLSSSPVHSSPI